VARNFKGLEAKMDPERRARTEKRVQEALKTTSHRIERIPRSKKK